MTKSKKRPIILKSTIDQEEIPGNDYSSPSPSPSHSPSELVVDSDKEQKPTDQTLPVAKLPSELVVKEAFSPPCQNIITENIDQPATETTNINMIVCEKKTRKSTKKTKMNTPNTSGDLRSPSELVMQGLLGTEAPLPKIDTVITETSPATMSPSKLVVEGFQPSDQGGSQPLSTESALREVALLPDKFGTTPLLPNSASKNQTTKKPAVNKKTKRGKLNSTVSDNKRNETPPTLQIANIILHLKCTANDLEVYNEEVNRQLTDPLLYNPSVPPDIMTYQPAEQYSVLEETKPSNNTIENYAYSESKNRLVGSNKFSETEVPNETTTKTDENVDSTVSNMKEINTKLKKLKISLFKNTSFMDKKSACFWCTYDFDNPECYIPRYEMDGTIHGYGSFCRPECAAAYLMKENLDDSTKFERYHMLNQIYSKIYDYKKNIKPSPNPYYLLDKYYGNLTIQEYRKLLKSDHLLLVIDKPLTRILPELHEDNEEFLTSIYGNNTTITGGTNTQSTGGTIAKSNTFGVYKVRRQSEKPVGVTKTSIIKEHFGITT
jgi:hypothetical protein